VLDLSVRACPGALSNGAAGAIERSSFSITAEPPLAQKERCGKFFLGNFCPPEFYMRLRTDFMQKRQIQR
jgi:hypothetical protein